MDDIEARKRRVLELRERKRLFEQTLPPARHATEFAAKLAAIRPTRELDPMFVIGLVLSPVVTTLMIVAVNQVLR
jgi:hypothetical protein